MAWSSAIFREYDIRGIVGKDITPEFAEILGKAYGSFLQEDLDYVQKPVVLGYDGRESSPELSEALSKGIISTGLDVLQIGLGPTPMLYFAVHEMDAAGGVMITGSHNPPNYNGFKIMKGKKALYGSEIKLLSHYIEKKQFKSGAGKIRKGSVLNAYLVSLQNAYRPRNSATELKIGWDPGNGAAGYIVQRLFKDLPGLHYGINMEIDGAFPNHHPDPSKQENLQQLIQLVQEKNLDIGFAFDGDGDRLGVIDDEGEILWGDQILLLLARYLLESKKGSTIIADVKTSQSFFDDVLERGGVPIMWKTGHSLIKAKMAETEAALGGEMSGHIFYADRYKGFDDGIYAAIRFMEMLADSSQKLSVLKRSLPQVINTPELRFECPEDQKFQIVKKVSESLRAQHHDFNTIDGIRYSNAEGWWLLRASNTQPALVARIEAKTTEGLERLKKMLKGELQKCQIDLKDLA